MTKELQAVVRLEQNLKQYECRKEDLETIFTVIKDYEMEHALRIGLENINDGLLRKIQDDEKKIIALEIIKEKRVDCWAIFYRLDKNYKDLTKEDLDYITPYRLTEEEFNILKEVLKWSKQN